MSVTPVTRTEDAPKVPMTGSGGVPLHSSDFVGVQIPTHLSEAYPNFKEFLRAYYEWIASSSSSTSSKVPLPRTQYLCKGWDSFETPDEFLDELKAQYLANIGEPWYRHNLRLFLANAAKFYRSKGTEKSFRFFFALMYSLDCAIYRPADSLMTSSSDIRTNTVIRFLAATGIPFADSCVGGDLFSKKSGFLAQIAKFEIIGNQQFDEAADSLPSGYVYQITVNGDFSLSEKPEDLIIRYTSPTSGALIEVGISSLQEGSSYLVRNAYSVSGVDIIDSGVGYSVGNIVIIDAPCSEARLFGNFQPAYAVVSRVNPETGGILSVEVIDSGWGYYYPSGWEHTDRTVGVSIHPNISGMTQFGGLGSGAVLSPKHSIVAKSSQVLFGGKLLSNRGNLLSRSPSNRTIVEFELLDDFDQRGVSEKNIREVLVPAGSDVRLYASAPVISDAAIDSELIPSQSLVEFSTISSDGVAQSDMELSYTVSAIGESVSVDVEDTSEVVSSIVSDLEVDFGLNSSASIDSPEAIIQVGVQEAGGYLGSLESQFAESVVSVSLDESVSSNYVYPGEASVSLDLSLINITIS